MDRPARVAFTWGWTDPAMGVAPGSSRVEAELFPDGGGTLVRLVHRGLATDAARLLHDDGWGRFLARLVAAVAGVDPPAYPSGDPAARLDELRPSDAGGSGSGG